jgi:hypothetical protein
VPPRNRHYLPVPDARVARLIAVESTTVQLEPAARTGLEQAMAALSLRTQQEFVRHPRVGDQNMFLRQRTLEGLELARRVRDANIDAARQYNGERTWH